MEMESSQLIVFILLTGLAIYVLVCNEVSVIAKKKGLKWAPVFLMSFFCNTCSRLIICNYSINE